MLRSACNAAAALGASCPRSSFSLPLYPFCCSSLHSRLLSPRAAMLAASSALGARAPPLPLPLPRGIRGLAQRIPTTPAPSLLGSREPSLAAAAAVKKNSSGSEDQLVEERSREVPRETLLYSVAPFPLLLAAALPGAETVRAIFGPFVEVVKTLNLPGWLVHWGHPGNMAVVLFAMGGYGTYLGFRIRLSKDPEEKAKAKDLHPKLLGGMFFFFALGATGGITAMLTSDKPILESPHATTGLLGLGLLTIQTILPTLFEDNPGLRPVHGLLGSSIMTLFLFHAALGLQLGLTF